MDIVPAAGPSFKSILTGWHGLVLLLVVLVVGMAVYAYYGATKIPVIGGKLASLEAHQYAALGPATTATSAAPVAVATVNP